MTSRPRTRIGSDEARRWVRSLRLGNPYAKSILMAVANYMNEDGSAYPGVPTLHLDTDIGEDTIVNRLRWCEAIGAIALFKCWIDENGVRNRDGRGRVTSSEIRFLFDADIEVIAVNAANSVKVRPLSGAAGHSASKTRVDALTSQEGGVSPRPDRGLTDELAPDAVGGQESGLPPVSPRLAPDAVGPNLEEERKEESPPNPPPGGVHAAFEDESWKRFTEAWGFPITDLPKAVNIWAALNTAEREQATIGAKGYHAYIDGERTSGRNRAVKDAHRWLRDKLWLGYVDAGKQAQAAERVQRVAADSPEGRALVVAHRVAHISEPREMAGAYVLPRALSAQELALAQAPPEHEWAFVPIEEENQCGAWHRLLAGMLGAKPRPMLVSNWGRNPAGRKGFMAPWAWPPRKDGSTGPPAATITNDDRNFASNQGLG